MLPRTLPRTVFALMLLTGFALTGCASHQFAIAEFEATEEPIYPPIDVFQLRPSEQFRRACNDFDRQSVLTHCSLNHIDYQALTDQFVQSGMFESVELASRDTPYAVSVSTAAYDTESAGELGQAAIAGATLLLVPVTTRQTLKVDALVTWNSEPLERFTYELPFTLKGTWTTNGDDIAEGLSASIVSHILRDLESNLRDLESNEVFSAQRLHSTLQSSDYQQDLAIPAEVGRFSKSAAVALHNPLYGAQIRYQHFNYDDGHIDVFVYPIGKSEFDNPEHLWRELSALRQDLDLMAKEGHIEDFVSEDIERITLANGEQLGAFDAKYSIDNGSLLASRTMLFAAQDKFVKVRATFSAYVPITADVSEFVQELSEQIQVPQESLFMARLRKNWRERETLSEIAGGLD